MVTFKVKKNDVDSRNSKVIIGEKDLGISETESKIICNYCSRVVDVRLSDDEYFCNNCSVTIIPSLQEDVRRVQDIITPEGPNNINETSIASIPSPGDNDEDVRIKKDPVIRGGLRALRDKGLKITNYTTTEREEDDE